MELTKTKSTKNLPDWGKMAFREYPAQSWAKIMTGASETAIDFVSRLVRYEMSQRITAKEVRSRPQVHRFYSSLGKASRLAEKSLEVSLRLIF